MAKQPGTTAALDDYRWLVSDEAGRILTELSAAQYDELAASSRLRNTLSAARVHLVLKQVELRRRAKAKFADQMFFTPIGLEQATDQWVAAYKARRFQSTGKPVFDLCCGIGGDLAALAQLGPVVGVDRDRVSALLAKANARAGAETIVANVADLAGSMAAWHIDPDRRPTGPRTTRVELYEPGPAFIERLLAANDAAAIKLAPAAELPERWSNDAELEWISRAGECRQLVAWFGRLATSHGMRRATVLFGHDQPARFRTLVGDRRIAPAVAPDFGRYLAEPDSAVLAADLVGALAAEHGLSAIAAGAVYLTGDHAIADPALAWFEIAETLPFDARRLKSLLRERGIGRLEIKKRGVDIDPEQLRRQLRVPGDEPATLFLARRGRSVTAVLAKRVSPK